MPTYLLIDEHIVLQAVRASKMLNEVLTYHWCSLFWGNFTTVSQTRSILVNWGYDILLITLLFCFSTLQQALYPCMRNVFRYMKRRRGGATICCTIVTWLCFFSQYSLYNKFVIIIHAVMYLCHALYLYHFMVTHTQKKNNFLSVDLTL